MLAQVVLTPSESKKLIATAVARMEPVKTALKEGMVVIHPSSSTYFLVEMLTGQKPPTNVWVCGVIVPMGACIEMGVLTSPESKLKEPEAQGVNVTPASFRHSWVVQGGKLITGRPLDSLFEVMGPKDVYIKGVNAIDATNTVGVLIGNVAEGGTIGQVMAASRRKGFKVIFPVGIEKLVPYPIKEAARFADRKKCDYAMGVPCSLFPCEGITVTEPKAFEILSGATAIPIAAGGLNGAEGATMIVLKGDDSQVKEAIKYAESAKGARLPQVRLNRCQDCGCANCNFPLGDKPWVV